MIAVIDYGAGNLRSIARALEQAGASVVVTSDPEVVRAADAIVLPGVGHAGHSVAQITRMGLPSAIATVVAAGRPLLGICVGMQVLFEEQEEGGGRGLGLLPGRVRSIQAPVKVPHMGWNRVHMAKDSPLGDQGDDPYYYFVHSFVVEPADPADIAATTSYGEDFVSVVVRGNVWGTQFHPEKSGDAGLNLIRTFVAQLDAEARTRPLRAAS